MTTTKDPRYKEDPTCESRINEHLLGRIEDLRLYWEPYGELTDEDKKEIASEYNDLDIDDEDAVTEAQDELRNNYGLHLDYVAANTFADQDEGYLRYQLSYGGPADEFRFFMDATRSVYRIEYWFLDWFDGARRTLFNDDRALLQRIFDDWNECGVVGPMIEKAEEE